MEKIDKFLFCAKTERAQWYFLLMQNLIDKPQLECDKNFDSLSVF